TAMVVDLSRKVIGLRLPNAVDELGVHIAVMDVKGQRGEVIEKLREHRPAAVLPPDALADDLGLELRNRVAQQNFCWTRRSIDDDLAQAFVFACERPVVRRRGRSKPSFIDAAT